MAKFTVRVELHNATREDYTKLHQQMARYGFTDIIASDEGRKYRLPPADYHFEGNATRSNVLEKAKAAAGSVVSKYAVLVTESSGRTWHGLEQINANAIRY